MNDIIERANNYEASNRIMGTFSAELYLIRELRIELEKQQDVVDLAMVMITQSYPPDCKGDLMRWNQLDEALAKLGEEK